MIAAPPSELNSDEIIGDRPLENMFSTFFKVVSSFTEINAISSRFASPIFDVDELIKDLEAAAIS